MSKLLPIFVMLLPIFGSLCLRAQTPANNVPALNLNVPGPGAGAGSSGGAFIGVADDATAIYWNPAGLSRVGFENGIVNQAMVSGRMQSRTSTSSELSRTYGSTFSPNYAAVTIGFQDAQMDNIGWVVGLAYQSVSDGNNYKLTEDILAGSKRISRSIDSRANLSTVSACFSHAPNESFSYGLTANYWFGLGGGYDFSQNNATDGLIETGSGKLSYSGINFTLGAMLSLKAEQDIPLRVGLRLTTPFKLKNNYEYSSSIANQKRNVDFQNYQNYTQKYAIPLSIGLGVSYAFGELEALRVAADVEYTRYANQVLSQDFYDYSQQNGFAGPRAITKSLVATESEQVYSGGSALQLRGGILYNFQMEQFNLPIRLGYRIAPTTFTNVNGSPVASASICGGAGMDFSGLRFDVAFERNAYTQTIALPQFNLPESTLKSSANFITVAVTKYF